jgi:pSer/pThr/pTyr-binding forkhead associated (FHA) protein
MSDQPEGLAKITWIDPLTQERREYVLVEGATASLGRSPENDISIPERHVSRQHAVVAFRDGVFTITDLGSANGTFVNDKRLTGPFPLAHGDVVRLYVPVLNFSAVVTEEEQEIARKTGTIIVPPTGEGRPRLLATAGPEEGAEYMLVKDINTIGRPSQEGAWDITIQDRAISRPHCRLVLKPEGWRIMDLGSANGTLLNGEAVSTDGAPLSDGDVIAIGETTLLFRHSSQRG